MRPKVGDLVRYWAGLGATRIEYGRIVSIEPAQEGREFMDLDTGKWSYLDQVINVESQSEVPSEPENG